MHPCPSGQCRSGRVRRVVRTFAHCMTIYLHCECAQEEKNVLNSSLFVFTITRGGNQTHTITLTAPHTQHQCKHSVRRACWHTASTPADHHTTTTARPHHHTPAPPLCSTSEHAARTSHVLTPCMQVMGHAGRCSNHQQRAAAVCVKQDSRVARLEMCWSHAAANRASQHATHRYAVRWVGW